MRYQITYYDELSWKKSNLYSILDVLFNQIFIIIINNNISLTSDKRLAYII